MPQRLAIIAASLAATIVLTVGLVAAGFGPSPRPSNVAAKAPESAAKEAAPPNLEPEVVYIKPAPKPKTVVLKQQAQAKQSAPAKSRKKVVQVRQVRSDDDRYEDREHEREAAAERRKKAAERAKERREHEGERDDD